MKYLAFLLTAVTVFFLNWKHSEAQTPADAVLEAATFEQRLDATIPLQAKFTDQDGQERPLAEYFDGRRPVVLALGYIECPMLCSLVHTGLVQALQRSDLQLGADYQVLSVSIDPEETPELAAEQKDRYLLQYGRHGGEVGWHSLVGDEDAIRSLTASVGYGYAYDEQTGEWSHPSGVVVLTPDGRVSKYFYGVNYDPRALRLGLVEASEGHIGSAVDALVLRCFRYDPQTGKYNLLVGRILAILAFLTVVIVAGGIGALFVWEKRS